MSDLYLNAGDSVALIACSDGVEISQRPQLNELVHYLKEWGLDVQEAATLMQSSYGWSGTPQERAAELNRLFADPYVKMIFDVSGGDAANGILPYLDYKQIRQSQKAFFGMSDLSVILNAIFSQTGMPTYHYQIMNLVRDYGDMQRQRFYRTFFERTDDLYEIDMEFLRGESLDGKVIGGNLRCLLKLAGTPYFPDTSNHVILLEGLSGRLKRVLSMLDQLVQIGALDQCSGLLIGTFSELRQYGEQQQVLDYILQITAERAIPVAFTDQVGHGSDSSCIVIG